MLSREKARTLLMIALYQHLLVDVDIFSYIQEELAIEDEFISSVSQVIIANKEDLVLAIDAKLLDWTFDRLGKVEQAILLLAAAELKSAINDRAVCINEAVNLAKAYCDDDSYKLINATLDRL